MGLRYITTELLLHGLELHIAGAYNGNDLLFSTSAFSQQAVISQITHMVRHYERSLVRAKSLQELAQIRKEIANAVNSNE